MCCAAAGAPAAAGGQREGALQQGAPGRGPGFLPGRYSGRSPQVAALHAARVHAAAASGTMEGPAPPSPHRVQVCLP